MIQAMNKIKKPENQPTTTLKMEFTSSNQGGELAGCGSSHRHRNTASVTKKNRPPIRRMQSTTSAVNKLPRAYKPNSLQQNQAKATMTRSVPAARPACKVSE